MMVCFHSRPTIYGFSFIQNKLFTTPVKNNNCYSSKTVMYYILFKFISQRSVKIIHIQFTLVISKSKGPSETLRDIRTSTYQMCRTEENTNQISQRNMLIDY